MMTLDIFIFPAVIFIILAVIIWADTKRHGFKAENRYDERQLSVQGKASKTAFEIALVGLAVCGVLGSGADRARDIALVPAVYLTMTVSVVYYVVYCIIKDAYFDIVRFPEGKYKTWHKLLLAVVALGSLLVTATIARNGGIISDGMFNTSLCPVAMNGLLFSAMLIAAIVHDSRAKRVSEK